MRKISKVWLLPILLPAVLSSGCSGKKAAVRKKIQLPPQMLVMPFACENGEIGQKVTESFIKNVSKKFQVKDDRKFVVFVASINALREKDPSSLLYPEVRDVPEFLVSFSTRDFFRELTRKENLRAKLYHEYNVHYAVWGSAMEQKLGELEAGNLVTAKRAHMRLLDVKTGKVLADEIFSQGRFEVVSPEGIGSQFAGLANRKIKEKDKAEKKREKERRRRLENIGGKKH